MIKVKQGEIYGKLTIIKEVDGLLNNNSGYKARRFLCSCECGNKTEVSLGLLRTSTKSCGCINRGKRKPKQSDKLEELSKEQLIILVKKLKKSLKEINRILSGII